MIKYNGNIHRMLGVLWNECLRDWLVILEAIAVPKQILYMIKIAEASSLNST